MGFRIRNWGKFQHYKNRRPPWIRLYRDLLDDPEFNELGGDLAKTLIKLWLAVSDFSVDGTLPATNRLALRMHVDSKLLAKQLIQLNHWVEYDDSNVLACCKQVAIPEGEGEQREIRSETEGDQMEPRTHARQTSKSKRKENPTPIPDDWTPTKDHRERAKNMGIDCDAEAERFKSHARANDRRIPRWNAAFTSWLLSPYEKHKAKDQSTNIYAEWAAERGEE